VRGELDLRTLVWTRGAAFPITSLETRLKCPLCGSRRVAVIFDLPKQPVAKRIAGMTRVPFQYLGRFAIDGARTVKANGIAPSEKITIATTARSPL
jgi:hypothetical protein